MKIRTAVPALALAVGLGAAGTVATSTAAPTKAEAMVFAFKVSESSERSVRACNRANGKGVCESVKAGKYAGDVFPASARQDAGCEWWEKGVRVTKRSDRPQWHNYPGTWSKITVAQRNCRSTGRGDVAPSE